MKVHCISKDQAIYLLNYYEDKNPELTLESLVRANILFEIGTNGVGVNPRTEYNYNNIMATWIIIKYLQSIDLNNIYLTQEPSSVFFLMDNEMYEVVIVTEGRESQTAHALQFRARTSPDVRYIGVVSDIEQLNDFYEMTAEHEHLNLIYALASGHDKNGMLVINIMEKE